MFSTFFLIKKWSTSEGSSEAKKSKAEGILKNSFDIENNKFQFKGEKMDTAQNKVK